MLDLRGVGNGTQGFIYASRALSHWVTHPVLLELFRLAVSGQECGPSHWLYVYVTGKALHSISSTGNSVG